MRRRDILLFLTGSALSPNVTRAAGSLPVVGFFSPNSPAVAGPWTAAFLERFRELGWIDSRNVRMIYRWGEGRTETAAQVISELLRLGVDVIVTHGAPSIIAAKAATSTIPIVFAVATDPVGSGFVESMSKPGGNLTGLSLQAQDLSSKRLELLREALPRLRRLAVMGDPRTVILEMGEAQAGARALGLNVTTVNIQRAEDIEPAFRTVPTDTDALYICATPLVNTNRVQINNLALAAKLPTMHGFREAVDDGALISYGPNFPDLFRRAAGYVDKILRGTLPGNIPIEQPTKFDLVINLKTAQALNVSLPPSLLAQADEVVE